jgi:hypothetical protein
MRHRTKKLTTEQRKFITKILAWVINSRDYQISKRERDGYFIRSLLTKVLALDQYLINEQEMLNEIRTLYLNEQKISIKWQI